MIIQGLYVTCVQCGAAQPVTQARAVDWRHTHLAARGKVCEPHGTRAGRQVDGGDGGDGGRFGVFSLPLEPVAFQAFLMGLPCNLHLLRLHRGQL